MVKQNFYKNDNIKIKNINIVNVDCVGTRDIQKTHDWVGKVIPWLG